MRIVKKAIQKNDDDETTVVITRREAAILHSVLYVIAPFEARPNLSNHIKEREITSNDFDPLFMTLSEIINA